MSAPSQANLVTMDYAFHGQPFIVIRLNSTLNVQGLDVAFQSGPLGWNGLNTWPIAATATSSHANPVTRKIVKTFQAISTSVVKKVAKVSKKIFATSTSIASKISSVKAMLSALSNNSITILKGRGPSPYKTTMTHSVTETGYHVSYQLLTATMTHSATMTKIIKAMLVVSSSSVIKMARAIIRKMSVATTSTPKDTRKVAKFFKATSSNSTSLSKALGGLLLFVSSSSTIKVIRKVLRKMTSTSNSAKNIAIQYNQSKRIATSSNSTILKKVIAKIRIATSISSTKDTRRIGKLLTSSAHGHTALANGAILVLVAISNSSLKVTRFVKKIISASSISLNKIKRILSKTNVATSSNVSSYKRVLNRRITAAEITIASYYSIRTLMRTLSVVSSHFNAIVKKQAHKYLATSGSFLSYRRRLNRLAIAVSGSAPLLGKLKALKRVLSAISSHALGFSRFLSRLLKATSAEQAIKKASVKKSFFVVSSHSMLLARKISLIRIVQSPSVVGFKRLLRRFMNVVSVDVAKRINTANKPLKTISNHATFMARKIGRIVTAFGHGSTIVFRNFFLIRRPTSTVVPKVKRNIIKTFKAIAGDFVFAIRRIGRKIFASSTESGKTIKSAGRIILSTSGSVLFLKRKGIWILKATNVTVAKIIRTNNRFVKVASSGVAKALRKIIINKLALSFEFANKKISLRRIMPIFSSSIQHVLLRVPRKLIAHSSSASNILVSFIGTFTAISGGVVSFSKILKRKLFYASISISTLFHSAAARINLKFMIRVKQRITKIKIGRRQR